jgi:hypothetical protein
MKSGKLTIDDYRISYRKIDSYLGLCIIRISIENWQSIFHVTEHESTIHSGEVPTSILERLNSYLYIHLPPLPLNSNRIFKRKNLAIKV